MRRIFGWVHQKFSYRLFFGAFARHPLHRCSPHRIQPCFGQIRCIVGTVTQQCMTVHAVLCLRSQLAEVQQCRCIFDAPLFAEKRLFFPDNRDFVTPLVAHFVINIVIDHGWCRDALGDPFLQIGIGSHRNLSHGVKCQPDQQDRCKSRNPRRRTAPERYAGPNGKIFLGHVSSLLCFSVCVCLSCPLLHTVYPTH